MKRERPQGTQERPSQAAILAALRWIFDQPLAEAYAQPEGETTARQTPARDG